MFLLLGVVNAFAILITLFLIGIYVHRIRRKFTSPSMEPEDAKFMRTDRRPGSLDAHPCLSAVILNYELEVQILGQNEAVLYGEKQNLQKLIDLPMLNSRTDCASMAKDVLAQCDLIHPSRVAELEQIIFYLRKRKASAALIKEHEQFARNGSAEVETANINSLNEYIELLYEAIPEKIKASVLVLQLARDSDNLEALAKNETILSALTRVLREDWKKSLVLTTNLIFIFFCFSTYTCFHHVILHYKIGSLCMNIIAFELQRYEECKNDFSGSLTIRRSASSNFNLSELGRQSQTGIPQKMRPKSGNFSDVNMKAVMEGSVYDDLSQSSESIDEKKQLSEGERIKRYRTLIRKQEQMLRVALFLLLNIAEDESVEEKMTKKSIVELLSRTLDRDNEELLVLVLTFLKKLSIMQVNKDDMAEFGVLERLPKMLVSNHVDVVHLTLKLLFNLSFDEEMRQKMLKLDILPKLASLLSDDRHQEIVLKLLYHLSYDDDAKEMLAYTDCVSLIVDMLVLNANDKVDQIMVALCINLAINTHNAQQMADNSRLHSLMTRALAHEDVLLMKMIHNIAEHNTTRSSFIEFVGDLAKAIMDSKNEEFIIECLGVLANLHLADLDWAEIFNHFNMMPWIIDVLKSNNAQLDYLLQVIVLLGTASHDEGCAQLLCKSHVLSALIDLLKTYQEDDEIVLQIIYVFLVALSHRESIDYVIEHTEAAAYLIDLLQDDNKAIRRTCNLCLDMISERNATWAERIKIERFRNHNAQWLQMVDSEQLEPDDEDDDDHELPPYLNTKYLSTAQVPPMIETGLSNESDIISKKELEEEDYFDHEKSDNILQDFEMESM